MEQHKMDAEFSNDPLFSDDVHFHLDGFVNCHIWDLENSQVIIKKLTHSQCVTVWCGFWVKGIVGPFFYNTVVGQTVNMKT